ncbi:MAG: hypothetical protein II334_05250 [Clostridia bacterium]|nr:hypothetical protein [Clostridia bacterium]
MWKTVTLELSLKPFKKTDDDSIRQVAKKVFTQWRPLIKDRETVSIMLWTSDGSEILDYNGKMDDTFDWCRYMGTANSEFLKEGENPETNIHDCTHLYMENPPVMTYDILKRIVSILKEEGKKAFPNSKILVGETFDLGPEFARSDFKYRRHREVCSGAVLDKCGFLDCTEKLKGDNRPYAAYENGIPDGTPIATFLGKQAKIFLADMGFDYLWLSNGMGFSANPWDLDGKIFDGKGFHSEKLENVTKLVFDFWRLFKEACPDVPIYVRGTNNSAGIDYATDGVPLSKIYDGSFFETAPPNSPWAAINEDFGLELMGHLTRICEMPKDRFMFRYYLHDPWWVNSPWYDRYGQEPHDIYLPMSLSRIDENGNVQTAEDFNILSIDNTFGELPDNCVNETVPHFLKAEKNAADDISPLVWVYPLSEFTSAKTNDALEEMYNGDMFIRNAINGGFPLNCVVSTDNFLKTPLSVYKKSALLCPLFAREEVFAKLKDFENKGGKVIYYGSPVFAEKYGVTDFVNYHDTTPNLLLTALCKTGYSIKHNRKTDKKIVMTLSPYDNALWLAVYNGNMQTETELEFPLGAPIFTNTDTEIRNGKSVYRFARSEYRECRVFIKQNSGLVELKELAPVSAVYHRKLLLTGLENATVYIFPENTKDKTLAVSHIGHFADATPVHDTSFKRVEDEKYGVIYKAENISGDRHILLPYKK